MIALLGATLLPPLAAMSPAAAAVPATCLDSQASAAAASAMARACAKRVEVAGLRSETTQTFAKPGGGYSTESSAEPRWARKPDGSWAAIDTALRAQADGTVSPAAAVLPVSFSGGGTGPLARLRDGDREISVSWPLGALPKPAPMLFGVSATAAHRIIDRLAPLLDIEPARPAVGDHIAAPPPHHADQPPELTRTQPRERIDQLWPSRRGDLHTIPNRPAPKALRNNL